MTALPHEQLADAWRAARPDARGIHLDSAACSRQTHRVLDAVAAHARTEAERGGYVAEVAAGGLLQQGRAALAALVGMAAADVAFTESATASIRTLLGAWRLPTGSRIGVLPGEYWANRAAFDAHGLQQVVLDADADGRARAVDVRGLAAVHVTVVASHRGIVQPVARVAEVCAAGGVPLVLDAAQALGVLDLTDCGADAVYGTSRKWLAGPRGVGFLLMRPAFTERLTPVLGPERHDEVGPVSHARWYESHDAHVAGRIGLSHAVGEHLAAGPHRVRERLAALGRATRERLTGSGWTVHEPVAEPTAVTTVSAPAGIEAPAALAQLAAQGFVLTRAGRERAPDQLSGPVLRISPHVDATEAQLDDLADAMKRIA